MKYRLKRRGVDHGWAVPAPRITSWAHAEPEVLRGAVKAGAPPATAKRLQLLRRGGDLAVPGALGISVNTEDPLEMHKVHAAAAGRELYVKVNWLSTFPGDGSIRVRVSHGTEILDDWSDDPVGARAAERLFDRLFPESARVTRNRKLLGELRRRIGAAPHFIQRILYSNSPGGGALFHHDFVPGQVGVCFAQLAGSTAWLTLPKRELARHIQEHTKKWPRVGKLLDYLDSADPRRVERLINHTPAFTRRLVRERWLFVLNPGDAILLPSHAWNDVAWHSVFTVGAQPNIALSFGVAKRG